MESRRWCSCLFVHEASPRNKMIIEEVKETEEQQCFVTIKDSPDKGKGLFITR